MRKWEKGFNIRIKHCKTVKVKNRKERKIHNKGYIIHLKLNFLFLYLYYSFIYLQQRVLKKKKKEKNGVRITIFCDYAWMNNFQRKIKNIFFVWIYRHATIISNPIFTFNVSLSCTLMSLNKWNCIFNYISIIFQSQVYWCCFC